MIASTASADKNSLSTQTFGYSNLQNSADYSGSTVGFGASASAGESTTSGVRFTSPQQTGSSLPGPQNSQRQGPSGFSASGVSDSASGTTYAAISAGTITVRGDAGTGQDSTAGLSRDTADANGSVQNTFNAQTVQDDMAIQQQMGQVGMQVAGDVADRLKAQADDAVKNANAELLAARASGDPDQIAQALANLNSAQQQDLLWDTNGAGRDALHAVVAGAGAAMGGGNVAGAVGGTIAGDVASGYSRDLFGNDLGGTILSNITSGAAGALTGGALGGVGGALSGANGATSADLYNRQIHKDDETQAIKDKANNDPAEEQRLTQAACYVVQCWAEYEVGSEAWQATYVSPQQAAGLTGEIAWVENQQTATGLFVYTDVQKAWDRILAGDDAVWNTAAGAAGQFLGLMNSHSGQTPPSDADPLTDVTNNMPPPAQGGSYVPIAQCAGAVCAVVPVPTPGTPGYVPSNVTLSSGSGESNSSSPDNSETQSTSPGAGSANVPPSILGADGKLPAGIGGTGTPIPMEASSNPNATAEQFAKAAFNGQTPVKVLNNITGEGSWVAFMPDGTAITYRPAGQASAATATSTATVEINSAAVRKINDGDVAKFKFPSE